MSDAETEKAVADFLECDDPGCLNCALTKTKLRVLLNSFLERGFQRAIDQVAEMFADESCIDHEVEGGFCIATRVRELGKRQK